MNIRHFVYGRYVLFYYVHQACNEEYSFPIRIIIDYLSLFVYFINPIIIAPFHLLAFRRWRVKSSGRDVVLQITVCGVVNKIVPRGTSDTFLLLFYYFAVSGLILQAPQPQFPLNHPDELLQFPLWTEASSSCAIIYIAYFQYISGLKGAKKCCVESRKYVGHFKCLLWHFSAYRSFCVMKWQYFVSMGQIAWWKSCLKIRQIQDERYNFVRRPEAWRSSAGEQLREE